MTASQITTHVLDTATGVPAVGMPVRLYQRTGTDWVLLGEGATDADGRVRELGPGAVAAGRYLLRFDTGSYFAEQRTASFFPEVEVTFLIDGDGRHCHVPLLLSPFAYSTYRGS